MASSNGTLLRMLMDISIDEIKRHPDLTYREEFDDSEIRQIADSIRRHGLFHPIVVDSDYYLILGSNRIEATKLLGHSTILARVIDLDDPLGAIEDENDKRFGWTISDKVRLGKAKEVREREKADGRRNAAIKDRDEMGRAKSTAGNLPAVDSGRVRDKVAASVGMSGKTYEKAKAVVEAAAADPSLAPIVEEMDRTGKVDPAHRALKEALAEADNIDDDTPETMEDVIKAKNSEIESFCKRLLALAKEVPDDPWLKDMGRIEGYHQKIKNACETLRSAKCHRPCPLCQGDGCNRCHNTGRVPKLNYDQMV